MDKKLIIWGLPSTHPVGVVVVSGPKIQVRIKLSNTNTHYFKWLFSSWQGFPKGYDIM